MADEIESKASPEVQAEAEKMGWIPPSRYKGDAERFVDADAYIERGQTILPIVQATNRRLTEQLTAQERQLKATQDALAQAQKAIDEIEERHTVATQRAVENARAEVKAQLARASEAGDHAGVAELTEQLVELNTKVPEEPVKKATTSPKAADTTIPADLAEWNKENPWFGTDKRRTSLALGIAQELRDSGVSSTGRAFYDQVKAELEAMLPPTARSKVEGDSSSNSHTPAASGAKGFAALPADAKAACNADARNFVGNGKKYKTLAEWQSRYAELYFQE